MRQWPGERKVKAECVSVFAILYDKRFHLRPKIYIMKNADKKFENVTINVSSQTIARGKFKLASNIGLWRKMGYVSKATPFFSVRQYS